jgi:hypothetical protein
VRSVPVAPLAPNMAIFMEVTPFTSGLIILWDKRYV